MTVTTEGNPMSEIIYVDMDGVLADYYGRAEKYADQDGKPHHHEDHFYRHLDPMPGAIEAFETLYESDAYDPYILSRPSWRNHHSWTDKRLWVEEHLGEMAEKRLILSHDKFLLEGDVLIDDHERHAHGFDEFIHFGTDPFADWSAVIDHLLLRVQDRLRG